MMKKRKTEICIVSDMLVYKHLTFIIASIFRFLNVVQVLKKFRISHDNQYCRCFESIDSVEIYEHDIILSVCPL